MRRREVIAGLAGVTAGRHQPMRQPSNRVAQGPAASKDRRDGACRNLPTADGRLAALRNGLHALGCIGGQKIEIETRWGTTDAASMTGRRTPKVNKGRRQQAFFAALAPRARAPDGTAWRPH